VIKLNDIFYQKWLKKQYKDLRSKKALEWFNENYFVALYDYNDNYVNHFEDVESISHAFNIPVKKVLYLVRTDNYLVIDNHKYKLCLVKKEKEIEIKRRR